MTAAGCHVQTDITQQVEAGVKAFIRIPFLEQRDDELTTLGDQLIFNSIQWWTGNNPIDPPSSDTEIGEFGI